MEFDLVGAVELTACVSIIVAGLSHGLGEGVRQRVLIGIALCAWFAVAVALGASGQLHYQASLGPTGEPRPPVGLGLSVSLPIIAMWAALFGIPWLRRGLARIPLHTLIGVNITRVLGLSFVLLYVHGRLPAPFAPVAGWGDIFVGATAAPLAWAAFRGRAPRTLLLLWNAAGLLDLVAAIGLGITSSPGPLRVFNDGPSSAIMSLLPWFLIPGYLVPLLATTHLALFHKLAGYGWGAGARVQRAT